MSREAGGNPENFVRFRPVMEAMTVLDRGDMEGLLMRQEPESGLKEYYSAHTDYMDPAARVVFIGICPGFEQMQLAFDIVKKDAGKSVQEVLRDAKTEARFGVSMRRNLISLADQTVLPDMLGIESCQALFDPGCRLMDNTCLLPYPVFRNGANYTGHAPKIGRSKMLAGICENQLRKIADCYPDALFIPLGKCVDEQVTKTGILPADRIVHGFPHPSGANGHRFRQLAKNLEAINDSIRKGLAANDDSTKAAVK